MPAGPTAGTSARASFGKSVSLAGDTVVISAHNDDKNSGAVYVFVRSAKGTWSQQAKLTASDTVAGDSDSIIFGYRVSLDGDTVAVTSISDDKNKNTGAVYIFTRSGTTWTEQAKLTAPDIAKPTAKPSGR